MSLTQVQESGLKLAEVVQFHSTTEPWKKLHVDDRLSKFHVKFWGKNMDDEEREWLDLKTQSRDDSTDDDVIVDDGDDKDTDNGDDEDTGDTDSDSDADDELIPGCYELDISPNPVSAVPKIWIRADYIRVYKFVESRYDLCYARHDAQAVVITGPPGIGEYDCLYFQDALLPLSIKARLCGYCMHYVGAVPKGNRSYGAMELPVLFSLMTVSTKWLRIFKTMSLRSSCGPLLILTRPPKASHQFLSRIAPVFSSIMLLLRISSAGNVSIKMWRMSPW